MAVGVPFCLDRHQTTTFPVRRVPQQQQQQLERERARVNWWDQLIPTSSPDAISARTWWLAVYVARPSRPVHLDTVARSAPGNRGEPVPDTRLFLTFSLLSHERYRIGATSSPLRREDASRLASPLADTNYRSYRRSYRSYVPAAIFVLSLSETHESDAE